nr:hypothetical protein [Tanacetum cinerariifolium]
MQTQTSNTLHNAIMEAGGKDHPPLLAPGNYVQWKSRIKRYIDTKPNHELIYYFLKNPPYKFTWADKEVPISEGSSVTTTETYMETYKNVSQDIRYNTPIFETMQRSTYGCYLIAQSHTNHKERLKRDEIDDPNITMEEYIQLMADKAQGHDQTFNWETATYDNVYCDDLDLFTDIEIDFPAIVYNDASTSNQNVSSKQTETDTREKDKNKAQNNKTKHGMEKIKKDKVI